MASGYRHSYKSATNNQQTYFPSAVSSFGALQNPISTSYLTTYMHYYHHYIYMIQHTVHTTHIHEYISLFNALWIVHLSFWLSLSFCRWAAVAITINATSKIQDLRAIGSQYYLIFRCMGNFGVARPTDLNDKMIIRVCSNSSRSSGGKAFGASRTMWASKNFFIAGGQNNFNMLDLHVLLILTDKKLGFIAHFFFGRRMANFKI